MAEIELNGLSKRWGDFVGVDNFNLNIANEEFLVLLGPSGCGKTTTMRMIAGLESVTSGEISIDGKVVNNLEPKDRDVAMVFQSYALYPNMTVYENIRFPLKVRKVDKELHHEKVMQASELVELNDFLHRKPAELSGGQRQRVALARAIVREPTVFLMDEPLSNLDAKLRVSTRAQIKNLQNKLRVTTIYVTHDQVEAMTLADRVVVMKAGVIQQVGTPQEIYNKPTNSFVASFIGSPAMNFVTGIVEAAGRGTALKTDDGSVIAMPKCLAKVGKRVTVGFRPEHMQLASTTTKPKSAISVSVTPSVIEPMGHETIVTCNAPFGEITSRITEEVKLRVGRELQFHVASDKLHFFDDKTGKRME